MKDRQRRLLIEATRSNKRVQRSARSEFLNVPPASGARPLTRDVRRSRDVRIKAIISELLSRRMTLMNQFKKQTIFLLLISMLGILPSVKAQADMFDGKPTFAQGTDLGYFIWREGDTWHIRWITKEKMRKFSGSIASDGGKLKSLKRIDVDSERVVLYVAKIPRVEIGLDGKGYFRGGKAPVIVESMDKLKKDGDNRIEFLARTNDDIDGFDFNVDDRVVSLSFVLKIDGRNVPQLIEMGNKNQKAESLPLRVRLK